MKALQILGISGSPRSGNSDYLLEHALSAAREVSKAECGSYSFKGRKMGPCIACGHCLRETGSCAIKDDFQELLELWMEADVIIYSVPVYHMSIPGQLKCFIDRLGNSMFGRYAHLYEKGKEKLPKLLKSIGSIAQGIHFSSGQEHTITDLINHALLMQCVPVTGDMWESYIGGVGWTSCADERDALKSQYEREELDAVIAVRSARDVGRRSAEVALILREGIKAQAPQIRDDPSYTPILQKLGLL